MIGHVYAILQSYFRFWSRKEAFSIISQGRVDEILNAKPVDRRQIIEESAGVLKYKKEKRNLYKTRSYRR